MSEIEKWRKGETFDAKKLAEEMGEDSVKVMLDDANNATTKETENADEDKS